MASKKRVKKAAAKPVKGLLAEEVLAVAILVVAIVASAAVFLTL